MVRYLDHIKTTWNAILECGDTILPYSVVDDITAERLEGRCPKHSASDRDCLSLWIEDRTIFPSIVEDGLRRALLANIASIPSLIPTLSTFFEALKYLEPICDVLKRLIGDKMKGSIRRSLLGCFFRPKSIRVQKSESYDMEWKGQQSKAAQLAYIELWALCARHFDGLTSSTPLKENGKDKPVVVGPNPVLWQRLAQFALDRGFRTPAAEQLAAEDSHSKLAIDYLKKANPLLKNFSNEQIQAVVRAASISNTLAEDEPEIGTTQLEVERRFGRPFELDLEEDKQLLFAPIIFRGRGFPIVNLQFARRDLFQCIFGPIHFRVRILPETVHGY
jgi:hypothetical protein